MKKKLMTLVNGHITLSSKLMSTLNERKLKQNTHLKQDLCSGFSRKGFNLFRVKRQRIVWLCQVSQEISIFERKVR